MNLTEQVFEIERSLWGKDNFIVSAGDRLKINAGGTEVYNEKVPNNKKWRIYLDLEIEESSV